MKCDEVDACLDIHTGFLKRVAIRTHLTLCTKCRQREAARLCLSQKIMRLEGKSAPPALTERLMVDAMTAAAAARNRRSSTSFDSTRTTEANDMRKVSAVVGFAVILIAVGVWLFPRGNGGGALTGVAQAMEQVRSVHYSGWRLDGDTGKRRKVETWVGKPDRFRSTVEGKSDLAVRDGKAFWTRLDASQPEVVIDWAESWPVGTPEMFFSEEAIQATMKQEPGTEVSSLGEDTVDGTRVNVTQIKFSGGRKARRTVIYADRDTSLVVKLEQYGSDGEMVVCYDRFEYNVDFPGSVFSLRIPEGVRVRDRTRGVQPSERGSAGGVGGG